MTPSTKAPIWTRAAFAALVLASSLTTFAQSNRPVLEFTGTISNPAPVTGETVRVDVRLTNQGPPSIQSIWTEFEVDGGWVVAVHCGPGGSRPYSNPTVCSFGMIKPGQRVDYSFDVQVGNSASTLSIEGRIFTYIYKADGDPSATTQLPMVHIEVPVTPASIVADLSLDAKEEPSPIPLDTPVTYETTITNHGPDDASEIVLLAFDSWGGPLTNVTGADCEAVEIVVVCRAGVISRGSSVTIRYSRTGSNYPIQLARTASVIASRSFDPVESNSSLTRQVLFGLPAELTTVMLPLVIPATDGALGSRWISEISMYVDSDEPLFVFPTSYICPITCDTPSIYGHDAPAAKLWRPPLWNSPDYPGRLLHFDRSRSGEVAFTTRIRDTSRELDTWGTAIPVVRDQDLVNGRMQLIDVAAGTRFRQTLRVYEPAATQASVRVRVWGDSGTETLLGERELVLTFPPGNVHPNRNAGFPIAPGYTRLDLATAFPEVDQYPRLRIELEAPSAETRYWAFVSITNNETQHVTLVVPGEKD